MNDIKYKGILAGVLVLLVITALFIFKLFSDTSSTSLLVEADESTAVRTTVPKTEARIPTRSATKTGTPPAAKETFTPQPSITPTFAILTGRVGVDKLGCQSGPGPYIGVMGLTRNVAVNVLGRDASGEWLFVNVEAGTGSVTSCWVEARSINLGGEVASLENYYPGEKYDIPFWKDYLPPANIRISRADNFVNIVWDDPNLLELSERENARSPRFILEAWVCRDGLLEFIVQGTLENTNLIIEDQAGCSEPSNGLLYSAGKHGYSAPASLLWPAP